MITNAYGPVVLYRFQTQPLNGPLRFIQSSSHLKISTVRRYYATVVRGGRSIDRFFQAKATGPEFDEYVSLLLSIVCRVIWLT